MKIVIDIPDKYFTEDLVGVSISISGNPDRKVFGMAHLRDLSGKTIPDLHSYVLKENQTIVVNSEGAFDIDTYNWCRDNNVYFVNTEEAKSNENDQSIKADHIESPYVDDQTIKSDDGKLKLSLVPREIIRAIARARMYGLKKYGDKESWKSVSKERYIDALYRHFLTYLDDIGGVDEESGLLHTDHIAFNIAAICELEKGERDG